MKKLITTFVSLIVLSMATLPVAAQTRNCRSNRSTYSDRSNRQYDRSVYRDGSRNDSYRYDTYNNDTYNNDTYNNDTYNNDTYPNDNYRYGQNRSVWNQHRDKITTAGGAVGGA